MYDINNKQYIVKQAAGRILHIFYKPNSGLFLSHLNKKGMWMEPSLITKDILPGYNICLDYSDKIYILGQDRQGNIKYIYYENEKWNYKTILRSRSFSPYDKYLWITSDGKALHFLYALRYSEKNLLSYQMMRNSGELTDPKVIDYVSESANPYFALREPNGNLCLFYTYQDNKYSRVGLKKYNSLKNIWSDFFPITEFNGDSNILSCAYGSKGTLFAGWQKHVSQNSFELVVSVRYHDSEEWCSEKLIDSSSEPYTGASMYVSEDKAIIYWLRESSILYSVSNDSGNTWSSPNTYSLPNNSHLHCIAYLSNCKDENSRTSSFILPGIISNGYRLAFLDDNIAEEKKPELIKASADDTLSPVLHSLKDISGQIEAVNKMLESMDKKLDVLEDKQKQLEVELGRHSSKLAITDTDLAKIRSSLTGIKQPAGSETSDLEKVNNILPPTSEDTDTPQLIKRSAPIMPGAGFASITPEFLRNLQKK